MSVGTNLSRLRVQWTQVQPRGPSPHQVHENVDGWAAARRNTVRLAMIAHELRSPLTPIRNAAALLTLVPAAELPRLQQMIERQLQRMTRLVDDLMHTSTDGVQAWHIERRRQAFAPLTAIAVEACMPALTMRAQKLQVTQPDIDPQVTCDGLRIVQMLGNLLDNASKYTADGGRIELDVRVAEDGELTISVSDSGIGIAADALQRVFEPFVQGCGAADRSPSGIGLGLTVVRELAEAHGGRVVAVSAGEGLGSRFVVTLPIVAV